MKIAHVTTVDISLRYLLLGQLKSLVRAGYEVVGVSAPGAEVAVMESAGIRHIAVPMTRRSFAPFADARSLLHLYRVFRREGFTIVHTHTPKAGVYGRWAARMARVPIIVHTSHGFVFSEKSPWYWKRIFVSLERSAAKCADVIFSVNRDDIHLAIREGICPASKLQLLGEGGVGIDVTWLDPDRFLAEDRATRRREMGIPDNARVVGFVGRLVREKGVLELFEAVREVRACVPDVFLLMVGPVDTAKADAVRPEVARDYGVEDICVFTGMRQDVPELYSVMDVFVLPSHREGFPRAPMEAAAMKVPCVVTNIRGSRDAVEHERNGLLVPVGDAHALADAICSIVTNPTKARQMGEEGRRLALERFDERKVFARVENEYARLLRDKGLSTPQPPISAMEVRNCPGHCS